MDWQTHVVLSTKLLEVCGCDEGAAIYSNLPALDSDPPHFHRVYAHIIENLPKILDVAIEIFTGTDMKANKKSYEYKRIKELEEKFKGLLVLAKDVVKNDRTMKITNDKLSAALSIISHLYFDTFNNPIQAFLPLSSICSGQWEFWDNIDYLKFRAEFYSESIIIPFREKIANSSIWTEKQNPNVFPREIRDRLIKEKTFNKPFDSKAMIKAMIIRIGELSKPAINYEKIDYPLRKFLRYLEIDEYLRIDREIEFLRRLENEIAKIIGECI